MFGDALARAFARRQIEWEYVIVDEGHRLKNSNSKLATTLAKDYTTKRRVLLTGTPLQNNLPELWSLLNFLLPNVFESEESFDEWFSKPFVEGGRRNGEEKGPEDSGLSTEERMLIINRLHELLRPFMLRRLKADVMHSLPAKTETVLRCPLSSWQMDMYRSFTAAALGKRTAFTAGQKLSLNNTLMQLRKVCNHPFLFYPAGWDAGPDMVRCCGKLALLDSMLPLLRAGGHRVLIFTQMTQVISILEGYLSMRGYDHMRLDGNTPSDDREKRMYRWNSPDSPDFCFLLSTRAGGLGLNLASADTVVIFDSDWNPTADAQASDRAHRIGQRSEVKVFRLVTSGSVEEKILEAANKKNAMSNLVVEAGKFDSAGGVGGEDKEMERRSMMETLLAVPVGGEEGGDEVDGGQDEEDEEQTEDADGLTAAEVTLLGQMATSPEEYELYASLTSARKKSGKQLSLFSDPSDVPPFMRYEELVDDKEEGGPRKRTDVTYSDGMTETQFLRAVEEMEDEKDKEKDRRREERRRAKAGGSRSTTPTKGQGDEEEKAGEERKRKQRSRSTTPTGAGGAKRSRK